MNKTQRNIMEAAIRVLSEDEYALLETIAAEAGVSRMTLHRYFNTRETLFEHIHEHLIQKQMVIFQEAKENQGDPLEQMKEIMKRNAGGDGFHLLYKEHREHEDHDPETCKFSQVNKALAEIIKSLREAGYLQAYVPDAWVFHMYDGILFTAWETKNNGSVAPKDIPDLAWRTFKNGLLETEEE
ncbi:TetR/AcrR family transcriptional regulator [Pontibacillus salicampi]|uniref:TetR/AcrR family transcriptional regulator n=1 Tax=Pontibacillus salicampi TaxID=1449801 RepID=A0ABV6LTW6_9BACI